MQKHSMGDIFRPIVVNSDWINLTGRQQQYNNTYQVDIIKHFTIHLPWRVMEVVNLLRKRPISMHIPYLCSMVTRF